MPDSDKKRCAEIAEWVGWEAIQGFHWIDPQGHVRRAPPDYATDSAAALELLDWLFQQGWEFRPTRIGASYSLVGFYRLLDIYDHRCEAKVRGLPSVALPRAIFGAVCEVMDAEKKSEVGDV